jgi:glycosyltransferase involved in cell wall biosynthesis
MPKISALIHVQNHESTLGRTLESLRCADEIVIVDHGSHDKTAKIARQYGAHLLKGVAGVDRGAYTVDCRYDWIFCILPNETVSEALEASIFEWKGNEAANGSGMLMRVRTQKGEDWHEAKEPEMRLADRTKINWRELYPAPASDAKELAGDLLRFAD